MENTGRYNKEDLDKATETLRSGGIILYPTDTVWGIGCDATNSEAVKKIFALKRRADAKAMLMLVGSEAQLQQYVANVPDIAWQLIDAAVHPLTIIYDTPRSIAPELLAEDKSAGFRITSELFSKALCQRLKHPIVSTSANISGSPAPQSFDQIPAEIIRGVDYVVEFGRECKDSKPSNIIKVRDNSEVRVIR